MTVLTKRIDDLPKGNSEKGKKDEGSTRIRAFMAIVEDDPSVGKADARSGQWVDITMKKDYLKSCPQLVSMRSGTAVDEVVDLGRYGLNGRASWLGDVADQGERSTLVTLDGEGVDWTSHSKDEQENYALMACNSSGSDIEDYPQRALQNKGIVV
ncbi:hypothetical protein Tco_1116270 [Tanacetum coccineum]